jgi:hypothetical protein
MKTSSATILLAVGVLGLVFVHSMRPPDGVLDALGMLAGGRQQYMKPPLYQLLMALCGFAALAGGIVVLRRITQDAPREREP